jgi:type II secretory pathway pseudopilin PulG
VLRGRAAFTLVELVVVIGLIILLAALTLTVSVAVVEGSEVRQTEQVLRLLDTSLQEWRSVTDRQVSWGSNGTPAGAAYDMQEATTPVFLITELLNTIARASQAREIVARIDPNLVHTYEAGEYPVWINTSGLKSEMDAMWATGITQPDGRPSLGLAVIDVWDQPIWVVHPGRVANPNPPFNDNLADADPDGTIQTSFEVIAGVAQNRQLLFVSAGPDGKLGDLSAPSDTTAFDQTRDNVYAYVPGSLTSP